MDAVTKEILESLKAINRRFTFVDAQINRLEKRVFTPAENIRFYTETTNTLGTATFTEAEVEAMVARVEEE